MNAAATRKIVQNRFHL